MGDLTRTPPEPGPPGQLGFVTTAPAALGDPFTVTVPGFSEAHFYEITRWQSRATTLPVENDEVLVLFDDKEEPWVAAWWPAAGDDPVIGTPGDDGDDGATWHTGAGAPAAELGVDGDLYLRTSNGDVYLKAAGAWGVVANLKGPKGEDGADGADGEAGAPGKDGSADLVRGEVSGTGEVLRGANFEAVQVEKGVYILTLAEELAPDAILIPNAKTVGCLATVTAVEGNLVLVTITSGVGMTTKTDSAFEFVAVNAT